MKIKVFLVNSSGKIPDKTFSDSDILFEGGFAVITEINGGNGKEKNTAYPVRSIRYIEYEEDDYEYEGPD